MRRACSDCGKLSDLFGKVGPDWLCRECLNEGERWPEVSVVERWTEDGEIEEQP